MRAESDFSPVEQFESFHDSKAAFLTRLEELAENPVGGDPLLANGAVALSQVLQEDESLIKAFHDARTERVATGGDLPSITGALMALAHVPNDLLFRDGRYDYPIEFGLGHPQEGVDNYRRF